MKLVKAFWRFVKYVVDRILETRALDAAAAIAYYAIFSIFPLILFLVAFNSSFLQSPEIQDRIISFAENYLPGSEGIVEANIYYLIHSSGTVGLLGTITLLWSATLVFASFASNINLAWTNAQERNFIADRLIGLMMIGILIIVLITSIIISTTLDLIPRLFPNITELYEETSIIQKFIFEYMPTLTIFGLFIFLYRYVPNVKVRWKEALCGGLFSTISLQIVKEGFVWYLEVGTGSYSIIYGSLGAVVAFMMWLYLSSCIVLAGGHVSAAVAYFYRPSDIKKTLENSETIKADTNKETQISN